MVNLVKNHTKNTEGIVPKFFPNLNSFFNDTNNYLYYRKILFEGIIGIMKI